MRIFVFKPNQMRLIFTFLLFSFAVHAQPITYQELGKRFLSVLQTGKVEEVNTIQAVPEIYRVIASAQMKDKSDEEIMTIVNSPSVSIKDKSEELFKTLVDYSIKTTDLTYLSASVSNFPNLSPQFFSMKLFITYQGIKDTLLLDVFELKGKWYLVDMSAKDDKLDNIIDKKGIPGSMYYKKKAALAQKNQNFTGAIKALTLALERSTEPELYYLRGYNYSMLKDYAAAKEDLNRAISMNPNFVKPYIELGYVHSQQFEYKEAISILTKVIALDSNSYFGHYYLADAYDKAEDSTMAAKYYQKADRISDFKYHTPVFALALMRSRMNNYSAAEPMYQLAEKRAPAVFEIPYYRGYNLINLGNYEEAVKSFDKCLFINPKSADALYERAYAKLSLDRFTDALEDFDKTIAINPQIQAPRLHIHRGNCFLSLNQKDKACESFRLALQTAQEEATQLIEEHCK